MLVLETERLLIRDVRAGDPEGFFEYMNNENYWRHVPVEPVTRDSVDVMVQRALLDQGRNPRSDYFLAVLKKHSDKLVGEAILRVLSPRWRQGEIGWGVDHRHVGNGIATEIGFAMLHFAFQQLRLHRIFAQCRVENQASRRIMTKLGMQEEGVLRENVMARGEWWSSVQYSILSTD
ncbi:MAG: [ribosomal protein S5]-alanine N-acetyltransferase [Acetobacteraceae bacterium]|jgi:RimJ/RimL family protein N-acetyltransferase|nr:[ribosomal protein S5]-alanine N-acetyltransferase [Acetobacteraceae bacterium]